jgi:hypothetical protein
LADKLKTFSTAWTEKGAYRTGRSRINAPTITRYNQIKMFYKSVLCIRTNFLGIRIHTKFFSDSDTDHMCSRTCTSEKKILLIEEHKILLFQVFDLRFFTQIFILQQCPNPYPNPNFFRFRIPPKLLDYFGFGSTTLL